jgi:predicted lipoprotein with Yx(FWY)xxD motif
MNNATHATARRRSKLAWTALALSSLSLLGATAAGAGGSLTVRGAANSKLGETVVVNPAGRTLYALSPETTHHLLCKSRECLHAWPPLTVPSRTTRLRAGAGVHGALGILKRSNGVLQVTLRGKPLYRFSGDAKSGEANGEGLESFGGTWHAAGASATAAPTSPMSSEGSGAYTY